MTGALPTIGPIEPAAATSTVREVAGRVAAMLREAGDGDRPVAGLDWSVAELGGHLVTVARRNLRVASGAGMDWEPGDDPHVAMAAYNEAEIDDLAERDPRRLADLLDEENANLVDVFGTEPDRLLQWPQYQARARDSLGVWLGELLVHGLDLARTIGRPWPITRPQAAAVFDGLVPALPAFVDRQGAAAAAGCYCLHVRGSGRYSIDVGRDGRVSVERHEPDRADLHVSVDPVAYLLGG